MMNRRQMLVSLCLSPLLGAITVGASAPFDDDARVRAAIDSGTPLPPGRYRLALPLVIDRPHTRIEGCHFQFGPGTQDHPGIRIATSFCTIRNCCVEGFTPIPRWLRAWV
jgi:hypothetical protein